MFFLSAFQSSSWKDPAQTLASDFGFEDNFNNTLKVEEKNNHQNRIVAPREPPPVPPLPPRKASYVSSNPQPPPPPIPKERVISLPANSVTSSSKPESVHILAQIFFPQIPKHFEYEMLFVPLMYKVLVFFIAVVSCQDLAAWIGRRPGAKARLPTPWDRQCSLARRGRENT